MNEIRTQTRPDEYFEHRVWNDDKDADYRCHHQEVVKVRSPHSCTFGRVVHEIQPGSKALRETAIVDGKYRSAYSCIACLGRWADEVDPLEMA